MVEDSVFDAESFMQQESDETLETKYPRPRESDYRAMIDSVSAKEITWPPKSKSDLGKGIVLDVNYSLLNQEEQKAELGVAPDQLLLVRDGVFCDVDYNVTPPKINVGTGINIKLGRLLEACGLNIGQPWNLSMLVGAGPIVIRVAYDPKSPDPEEPYLRVTRTAMLTADSEV